MAQELEGRHQIVDGKIGGKEQLGSPQSYFDRAIALIDSTQSTSPHEYLHIMEVQIDNGLKPIMTPGELLAHRVKTNVTLSKFDENLTVYFARAGESDVALERARALVAVALDDPTGELEMAYAMRMCEGLTRALPDQLDKSEVATLSENALSEYLNRRGNRIQWTASDLVVYVAKAKDNASEDPLPVLSEQGGFVLKMVSQDILVPELGYATSAERLGIAYAELGEFDEALKLAETILKDDEITSHNFMNILSRMVVEQAKRGIDPGSTIDRMVPLIPLLAPCLIGEENMHTNYQDRAFGQAALAEKVYGRRDPARLLNEARFIVYSMPNDAHHQKIESLIELARVEGTIFGSRTAGRTLKDAFDAADEQKDYGFTMSSLFLPAKKVEVADAAIDTGNLKLADNFLDEEYGENDFVPSDTRGVDLRIPLFAKLGAAVMNTSAA